MKQRNSVLLISVILLVVIFILECFIDDEETIKTLPVNEILNYNFEDSNTKINISLFEINSSSECAKNINSEIKNLFIKHAQEIIDNHETYEGKYELITEYSINNNLLSLKIYEKDSNDENTSGNIYATIYNVKKDYEYNLSAICNYLKLDYESVVDNAKKYASEKNKNINFEIPYVYLNSKGNLELIIKDIIQIDRKTFWYNIEIYEVITNVDDNENKNDNDETDEEIDRVR